MLLSWTTGQLSAALPVIPGKAHWKGSFERLTGKAHWKGSLEKLTGKADWKSLGLGGVH